MLRFIISLAVGIYTTAHSYKKLSSRYQQTKIKATN